MEKLELKRVFLIKDNNEDVRLPDINPLLTPEEVIDHYSNEYPKLHTGIVLAGVVNEDNTEVVFEIKDNFGHKG